MMQGYFRNPTDQVVVFDAFYRTNPYNGGYAIACGLDQVIEYIKTKPFGNSDRVVLTCNKDNAHARKLYEDRGFTPTGSEDEDEIELTMTVQ